MQIPPAILERVLRGGVTLAFLRRIRPTVKSGDELRAFLGVVRVRTVTRIDERDERALRVPDAKSSLVLGLALSSTPTPYPCDTRSAPH